VPDRTIDALARQADDHPDDGAAVFRYADALDAAGREAEAIPVYRRALSTGLPDELAYRAMVQVGSSLRLIGQAGEAVAVHRQALARWPGRVANWPFLALALHDTGRPAEALGQG
jgi:tetratricopeptide (TPR) repeat protein